MFVHPVTDLSAAGQPVVTGASEMDAAIQPTFGGFTRGRGEAGEWPHHAWKDVRAGNKRDVVGTVEPREHGGRGAAEGAVTRDVIGKWRCRDEGLPGRVPARRGIPPNATAASSAGGSVVKWATRAGSVQRTRRHKA